MKMNNMEMTETELQWMFHILFKFLKNHPGKLIELNNFTTDIFSPDYNNDPKPGDFCIVGSTIYWVEHLQINKILPTEKAGIWEVQYKPQILKENVYEIN